MSAWPGRRYPATITRVAYGSTTTDNVVTYVTTLEVANDDLSLRPGMTATATITTTDRQDVLLVPNTALRYAPSSGAPPAARGGGSGGIVSALVPRPGGLYGRGGGWRWRQRWRRKRGGRRQPGGRRRRGRRARAGRDAPRLRAARRPPGRRAGGCRRQRRPRHRGAARRGGGTGTGHAGDRRPAQRQRAMRNAATAAGDAARAGAPAGAQAAEPAPPLIRLRGVTKVYGQGQAAFQALKGVDLDVEAGEFVAVMGPSGSGKSTAMNLLGCLDTPSAGVYLFRGVHVERLARDQRARLRRRYLGFVFQGFNLLARTSAQENVELPLLYRGESATARHAAAREALASVGLAGWEHHTPAELSGGQQQRVAIARAIVTRPDVLLADEPTGNLDSQRSAEIMELLTRLNADRGITVLMVTHEPDMAAYARRTVRFVDGVVASDRRGAPPLPKVPAPS